LKRKLDGGRQRHERLVDEQVANKYLIKTLLYSLKGLLMSKVIPRGSLLPEAKEKEGLVLFL